jgi:hypothetical protein
MRDAFTLSCFRVSSGDAEIIGNKKFSCFCVYRFAMCIIFSLIRMVKAAGKLMGAENFGSVSGMQTSRR